MSMVFHLPAGIAIALPIAVCWLAAIGLLRRSQ
jgi:hypothetical protein